jgi:hypothetical protein
MTRAMAPSESPLIDIEELMERIRQDVAKRRSLAVPKPEPARSYVPGTLLRFGPEGNVRPYLGTGWAEPEPGFHWTLGEVAEITFHLNQPTGDLVLSFSGHPHVGGETAAQEISATWNGVLVGEWSIREGNSFHTLILSHIVGRSPTGILRFHMPQSFSPLSRQLSADPRQLGFKFSELVLRTAAELGLQ